MISISSFDCALHLLSHLGLLVTHSATAKIVQELVEIFSHHACATSIPKICHLQQLAFTMLNSNSGIHLKKIQTCK